MKTAFLQSDLMKRDIFVKPPVETHHGHYLNIETR